MPGVPPVPIPNTAVKPRAANGSRTKGPARVGRCQVYGPDFRKRIRASFFQPGPPPPAFSPLEEEIGEEEIAEIVQRMQRDRCRQSPRFLIQDRLGKAEGGHGQEER